MDRNAKAAVLVVALLGLGTAALVQSGQGGEDAPDDPVDVTASDIATMTWDPTDVRISDPDTQFPGDQKSLYEVSVAIDPTDPDNVLAFAIDLSTQNVDGSYSTNRAYRSTDGGATWTDMGPMVYRHGDAFWDGGDPVALFTPSGTAYFASLAWAPDGSESGIYVHRSDDGGASWTFPVQAVAAHRDPSGDSCDSTDKEWLSHDAATGALYLGFTRFRFACSSPLPVDDPVGAVSALSIEGIDLFFARSDDGGATWSEPILVWGGYALGAMPRATPGGTILMPFWATVPVSTTGCPSVIGVLGTALFKSPGTFDAIIVARSTDGGATWSFHQEDKCTHDLAQNTKPGRFVGGNFLPAISVDATTGDAFVVYPHFNVAENRYATRLIISRDDGVTWSEPVELTPGPEDSRMPSVFADGGVVHVPYLVSRDADDTGDAAYVVSTDGGATWSERVLLTSLPWQLADDPDLGDYIGVDLAGGRIVVAWTDARHGLTTEIWSRAGTIG